MGQSRTRKRGPEGRQKQLKQKAYPCAERWELSEGKWARRHSERTGQGHCDTHQPSLAAKVRWWEKKQEAYG